MPIIQLTVNKAAWDSLTEAQQTVLDVWCRALSARPPFYLKSVAPPEIDIQIIFNGVLPFIGLQLIGLDLILFFPEIALWPIP